MLRFLIFASFGRTCFGAPGSSSSSWLLQVHRFTLAVSLGDDLGYFPMHCAITLGDDLSYSSASYCHHYWDRLVLFLDMFAMAFGVVLGHFPMTFP